MQLPPLTALVSSLEGPMELRGPRSFRRRPTSALCGLVAALPLLAPQPARAVDGCQVLLCLAAPSWRSIEQCVPTIHQLIRDLARGKPFPVCSMSGAGNSAEHAWSNAPDFCPPQYTHVHQDDGGASYWCDYAGAVSVSVNGLPFTRTWWALSGDSVTEFSPGAKAQLGTWDTRFDDDFAAWAAALPPSAPPTGTGN